MQGFKEAKALVERHPKSAIAHFALSYVLRYAGMLHEAAQQCDTALSLDPGNYQFRSCSQVFELLGNTDRALDYLRLDPGSLWVLVNMPLYFKRAGKAVEARESVKEIPADFRERNLMIACFGQPSTVEIEKEVESATPFFLAEADPENRYWDATLMAECGKREIATQLLRSAIAGHYCAYTALQTDRALETLRSTPEFAQLLSAAKECQNKFVSERAQSSR